MKYSVFFIKLLTLLLVLGILYYYQTIAASNAALVEENEARITEVENHNREVRLSYARMAEEAAHEAGTEISYQYRNGTFEGTAEGYGGLITAAVSLEYDILTDVQVLSHEGEDPAYYAQAEGITNRILSAQNTQVDAISGATFSSEGILEAVNNALKEAEIHE